MSGYGFNPNCISRDIIVPKDIPLYALHYTIQRAFGWENSHRHVFKLPVTTVYDRNGNRRDEPKPWYKDEIPTRVEVVKMEDLHPQGLLHLFEKDPMALLERLPINSVLADGRMELAKNRSVEEQEYIDSQISKNGREVFEPLKDYIHRIVSEQIDSPSVQVQPCPITDTILYTYNFMNRWKIKITASENCSDLVESGRITQAELDKANVKCREVYRPVMIASDGEMMFDGGDGLHGFAEFLRAINPDLESMSPEEQRRAKREKKKAEEQAKRLGWKGENVTNYIAL